MHRLPTICAAILVTQFTVNGVNAQRPLPQVPDGFTIKRVAESPLVKYPMMAAFDDQGRLFVAESAGDNLRAPELLKAPPNFVRMLEDSDGDGVFDKSTIFADKMTLPMGALWYRGALYVASPPSIWKLEDTDGDGVADRRTELVNTFGFTGNAASIHGCFLGPCGRIYWCDGRHGHEFTDENGHVVSQGKAARIFSCLPNGTDIRVHCGGGMDNPVEVDFTETGEMLGTVNILLSKPRVDCLMHWVDGGVYPRRDQEACIAEFVRTGDLLEPMTQYGHVAVSGMTRYRSSVFGDDYHDSIFVTIFNTHQVIRSDVKRSGATFTTTEHDFLVSSDPDFHPTDVLEDADGSLLVIDTGGWFRIGCPTSQIAKPEIHGAIYRIRKTGSAPIRDPRGIDLRLDRLSADGLVPYLDDSRPSVRSRAIDLFPSDTSSILALHRVLSRHKAPVARRNAVWALARLRAPEDIRRHAVRTIAIGLNDEEVSVRIASLRALGETIKHPRELDDGNRLFEMVVEDAPPSRREAARTIGLVFRHRHDESTTKIRREAIAALMAGLRTGVTDRVMEHAFLYSLIRCADPGGIVEHLDDSNPRVRRAALIALDQTPGDHLTREQVIPLLDTDDPDLQQAALEVIGRRPGWAGETMSRLRGWLSEDTSSASRIAEIRGFLIAQSDDRSVQGFIADTFAQDEPNPVVRSVLLEVMERARSDHWPTVWNDSVSRGLRDSDIEIQRRAMRVIQTWDLTRFDAELRSLARKGRADSVRSTAMEILAPRLKILPTDWFSWLTGNFDDSVDPLTQLAAARVITSASLSDEQLLALVDRFHLAGPLALPLLIRAFEKSNNESVGLHLVAALETNDTAVSLSADELARILTRYPAPVQEAAASLLERLGGDLTAQRERLEELLPLIQGGDAERGRDVFFSKKAACASCHRVGGEGGRVGPDLTSIGRSRTGRDFLEAIVFPSASLARGFRTYVVVTEDGRVHAGLITDETSDTITLRTAELSELRIQRKQIDEMRESPVSVMPKGFDRSLTQTELRDLVAYLQSRGR